MNQGWLGILGFELIRRDSTEPKLEISMFSRFAAFATILFAAVLSSTPCLQAQKSGVKNIVLVHGAWADGSGWKDVYDKLVRDGFNVA